MEKNISWKNDMEAVAQNYSNHLKTFGIESPNATMSRSDEEHDSHFKALFENLELTGDLSILDIGCGKGALISFIKNHFPVVKISEYLGIDLVSDFLTCARKAYPSYHFELKDFLDSQFIPNVQYDCVVGLGVFVMKTHHYDEFVESFIKKMCESSSKYVVFNLISKIDKTSIHYCQQGEIGFPVVFLNEKLEKIIQSISGIRYQIRSKTIFKDSTDSFVTIWKNSI